MQDKFSTDAAQHLNGCSVISHQAQRNWPQDLNRRSASSQQMQNHVPNSKPSTHAARVLRCSARGAAQVLNKCSVVAQVRTIASTDAAQVFNKRSASSQQTERRLSTDAGQDLNRCSTYHFSGDAARVLNRRWTSSEQIILTTF